MVQYEIKITGRVQGVGFRYFSQQKATGLDLKGWVKNTVDGAVLVSAQGSETDIDTFVDYLRIGPTLSRVKKISKVKMKKLSNFNNFSIK
ncbi:MAG: acylphosphatase [Prolixibacteraceae bacterium]|nr:acylphosphatase [Prolixibacteraceae bacterium]